MKKTLIILLSIVSFATLKAQTVDITGTIFDETKQPISFVNVYIDGTLDGTSTNELGQFVIKTEEKGSVTLKASFVGYQTYSITKDVKDLSGLQIYLKPSVENLVDVVIVAGNYALKSSTLENQSAVNLVTTAGSDGDLNKALTMLPGSQAPGVDGRLQVRGGNSRESQTYIDGMHVLSAYTANSPNSSSRLKYSPFHFEGINFSTGGYGSEYSQSLSSILPLDTKDKNTESTYGVGLMNVSIEGGGTQAWDNGSASLTANYTDMTFYNATLHPRENDKWDIPYRDFSIRNQLRFNFTPNSTLKTYYGYDKTQYRRWWEEPFANNLRNINYDEDNLYLNTTFRIKLANNVQYFAGVAYSWNTKEMNNSLLTGDRYAVKEQEIHLKTKASKRFTNLYKIELGAETYLKSYDMKYATQSEIHRKYNHNISGIFISNDFNFTNRFFFNLSGRVEYSSLTDKYAILPRAALNYQIDRLTLSAVVGKYQQATDPNYLIRNEKLAMETNWMSMFGMYYNKSKRVYRAEFYNKKYNDLPLLADGTYTSGGDGYSRGVDLYYDDSGLLKNVEYTMSYSYNNSKRKYLDYPVKATPDFVTHHNASLMVKYFCPKLRTYFSFTNSLASGRAYHDPNKTGFMNAETPLYHALGLGLTVLPHPRVIIYAGLSNALNRKNVYGYSFSYKPDTNGRFASIPTTSYQNRTFYVGIFVNFGKGTAYKPSYF